MTQFSWINRDSTEPKTQTSTKQNKIDVVHTKEHGKRKQIIKRTTGTRYRRRSQGCDKSKATKGVKRLHPEFLLYRLLVFHRLHVLTPGLLQDFHSHCDQYDVGRLLVHQLVCRVVVDSLDPVPLLVPFEGPLSLWTAGVPYHSHVVPHVRYQVSVLGWRGPLVQKHPHGSHVLVSLHHYGHVLLVEDEGVLLLIT